MSILVDVCGWYRENEKGRGKEKGKGTKQEQRSYLTFFFFKQM